MIEFLDYLNTEYRDNIKDCLQKIKPLAIVLQSPMTQPIFEHVEKVVGQCRSFVTSCRTRDFRLSIRLKKRVKQSMTQERLPLKIKRFSQMFTDGTNFYLLGQVSVADIKTSFSKI
jgi:hypothetical protein